MEITINGKRVVLRTRFPTREHDVLRAELTKIGPETPWQERAKILRHFVESWEFAGDPQNVEAWGDLDLFTETLPLEAQIAKVMTGFFEQAKN